MARSSLDTLDFVMGFVANSKKYKSQYIDRWQEVLANYVVEPEAYTTHGVGEPYSRGQNRTYRSRGIVLKDGETHKAIMTYASRLVLTVLGDTRGEYIRAVPTGWEDADRSAPTVTRLLRYALGISGHFRSMVEAVIDMLLFGTGIVEIGWKYLEREQPIRQFTQTAGVDLSEEVRGFVVAYDDVTITPVDNADFFPDPSEYRIENMPGAAKRFKMNALKARYMADQGVYRKEAVERAIKSLQRARGDELDDNNQDNFREGYDQPEDRDAHEDFVNMMGFEYWGDVPWEDDLGSSRRVVTVLNNEVVRDVPYPLADADLPWRTLTINPVVGRFYGVSPAEVIRWDQDLQDAIKILLAEAIIRQVHPPIAFDPDSEIDMARLRRWSPDAPIPARGGIKSVGTLQYDANVFNGFNLVGSLKQSMQETSGAVNILQGQGLGGRASATEAQLVREGATRPELAAALLEREDLPGIARSILRRYQQFLPDTEALAARVGQLPEATWIGDIQGDFDVQFVGSRLAMTRQQKLQSYDRLAAITGAIPAAQQMVPWQLLLRSLIGDVLELPEVAAKIADPESMRLNVLLNSIGGGGQTGGGNGTVSTSEPAGLIPAQAAGGDIG